MVDVEERRRQILDLLEARGQVTVEELARQFTVSAVTARTDLDALARIGALHRSHGGAIRAIDPGHDYPLRLKTILHQKQKAAIARAAVQLVRPYQTLMLDSGTTTGEIARQLREAPVANVKIVTNSLGIAAELSAVREFRVVLVGGMVREVSQSCVGPEAERMMRGLYADHLFLAADGVDPASGPCTPDALEARLNSLMVAVSSEVTVVADSSKFGSWNLPVITPFERIHRVITDAGIAPEFAAALRTRGVELIAA